MTDKRRMMIKAILISFVVFLILAPLLVILEFEGAFDKKYSRESLVQNFIAHENDFADVAAFFDGHLSKNLPYGVSFGLGRWGSVNLYLYPDVIDPANKIIGGGDLRIGSPQLDSALVKLGWTNEIIIKLSGKLAATNCDWIRTLEGQDSRIEIYPYQTGWGSFTYFIYQKPVADSLVKIIGRPIGNAGFGKRVVLSYSSAL